jgi:ribosome-binding factor A
MVMKKNSNRMVRINDEIMKELSNILRSDLKDPRIGIVTSVSKVDTTNDLKYCKVYISILGDDEKRKEVMDVIKGASGYIRSLIARRINLRITPEFTFKLDDSLDYSFKIDKILKDIHESEKNAHTSEESEGAE